MLVYVVFFEETFPRRLEVTMLAIVDDPFMFTIGVREDLHSLPGSEVTPVTLVPHALVPGGLVSAHVSDVLRPEVTPDVLTPDQP